MKQSTVIAATPKGHRIFLEGIIAATGRPQGQRYNVAYTDDAIHIIWDTAAGKLTLVSSKGGVIDLQSKKVTAWAQGATVANITVTKAQIIITRGTV